MDNVLVTGGAGFMGSNFIRYLLRAEPGVCIYNLDALTYAGNLDNLKDLPDRHVFIHGDICDFALLGDLFPIQKIDTVVHFAAESHVDRSITEPALFMQTNFMGTFTLLEHARRYRWFRRFHHISTDEVFGHLRTQEIAWDESAPYGPRSPYSASKASADHLVRAYGNTYGLPYTISHSSNNYGPYQYPEKLIPLTITNALQGQPITIHGDGQQVRDWLHVDDHSAGVYAALKHGKPGETYNFGGGNELTVEAVILEICAILDNLRPSCAPHADAIKYVEDRSGQDRRYALNTEKARRELGWEPKVELRAGLLDTVRWYLERLAK
jgi:dTDP-glucose 4,6-dehydratase